MNQEKIGKFISKCRKEKNLTQEQLASTLGVTEKSISNWENGRNMPDLSLFQPLCKELNITLNDLLSGEKIEKEDYQERLEANIINTINYTSKKIEKKNHFLGILLITFGILTSVTAIAIFPSESSWGGIYSILGGIISLFGVRRLTKQIPYKKRIIYHFSYFVLFIVLLLTIDYIGVINIHQAPRFSLVKVSGEKVIYYDTPFYDVIRCHVKEEDETFKVVKNQKYDQDNIDSFCK